MAAEEYEKMSASEKKKEDWMNSKWRPMMGWIYMGTCFVDFVLFPILWSLLQAVLKQPVTQWQPLTLQGAGLYHIAMGAVLGIAAMGRTQEKLAGANNGGAAAPAASTTSAAPATSNAAPAAGSTAIKGYSKESYANNVSPGSTGFYVTAGVYGEQENADKMVQKLKAQGIQSRTFRDPKNNMVYVYLLKFGTYEEASTARESNLNGQYTGKLWVKVIQ